MNERIKALADQCYYDDNVRPDGTRISECEFIIFDKQKFAELIVRECAQVSLDDISDGDACCTNTADRIARQIKEHFGVE